MKNIVIITTGQPASNPRVLKEYEALKSHGYNVKVLYTFSALWSYNIDEEKFNSGKLNKKDFVLVGGNPDDGKIEYFLSRALYRVFREASPLLRNRFVQKMTVTRSAFYLWLAAKKYPADLYIAHYLGALPAAVKAAKINKAAVIFDAEDFHRGEEPYFRSQVADIVSLENELLPQVDLITTASPLITGAYRKLYPAKEAVTINNVFSRKFLQPPERPSNCELKIFWFSQNVGPKRGLEVIIEAMNLVNENISLHLLGNIRDYKYVGSLLGKAMNPGKIYFIKPAAPDEVFKIAAAFDIGLAAEVPYCENRDICLTNKIFTYLLAGNCILASDTAAQKDLMNAHPGIGLIYHHDDAHNLAEQIKLLYYNRSLLSAYRKNAVELAAKSLNWENESEKFIAEVNLLVPLEN